ncbi:hypothetical protein Pcar_3233 [Syntrophotalea carbinolica DSM 2380]|uniref:Uncharacterized protein n=1 Tax=Syntrophotalea carbinolica (strain DSM 2380 / NBRC 103641 / GraBd1) TaxID=338963 RepID=Q0C6T4_SYNC1|nr:hypothetical protein Pcar_3233 [Syntrophotalea carbinolica DSM 2380]
MHRFVTLPKIEPAIFRVFRHNQALKGGGGRSGKFYLSVVLKELVLHTSFR